MVPLTSDTLQFVSIRQVGLVAHDEREREKREQGGAPTAPPRPVSHGTVSVLELGRTPAAGALCSDDVRTRTGVRTTRDSRRRAVVGTVWTLKLSINLTSLNLKPLRLISTLKLFMETKM